MCIVLKISKTTFCTVHSILNTTHLTLHISALTLPTSCAHEQDTVISRHCISGGGRAVAKEEEICGEEKRKRS